MDGACVGFFVVDERKQRLAVQFCRRSDAGRGKNGRKDVGGAHLGINHGAAMSGSRRFQRRFQNERNVQRRVVKKQAVSIFSVLAQAFAVIAGDDDDGVVVDAGFLQKCNPVGDRGIGVGNFAVVQMVFVFLRERRRRLVGIVRIEQVHPHEVRSGAVLVEPAFGVLDDFHAAALDASPALFSIGSWRESCRRNRSRDRGRERACCCRESRLR